MTTRNRLIFDLVGAARGRLIHLITNLQACSTNPRDALNPDAG